MASSGAGDAGSEAHMNAPELDTIHHADALELLCAMPDNSVHCIVTSPPYYGLRDYGPDGQIGLEDTPHGSRTDAGGWRICGRAGACRDA